MLFKGYRLNGKYGSYAVAHFSDDFDSEQIKKIPLCSFKLENAFNDEIEECDYELKNDEKDVFLIVGVDSQHTHDWSFLEKLAESSSAKCKIIICTHSRKFKHIKGYDAVISATNLSDAINHLVCAISSCSHSNLTGIDEADIISVIATSKIGYLKSYASVDISSNWQDTLNASTAFLEETNQQKKVVGVFTMMTLPNILKFHDCAIEVANRQLRLSKDLVYIVGGKKYEDNFRYYPQQIIDLIMFE